MSKRGKTENKSDLEIWLVWETIDDMEPDISTESLIQRVCDQTGKPYSTVISAMTRHPDTKEVTTP